MTTPTGDRHGLHNDRLVDSAQSQRAGCIRQTRLRGPRVSRQWDQFPTLFRGVFWDDHWEFDAPCVLYTPFKRYGIGGNSYHLHDMVADVCLDLSLGENPRVDFAASDIKEFKWRGWSLNGFRRRKNAWHLTIAVKWWQGKEGPEFSIAGHKETWGPH